MDMNPEHQRPKLPPSGLADQILQGMNPDDAAEEKASANTGSVYDFADQLPKNDDGGKEKKESFETWVNFTLGKESFGLPVSSVQEILRAGLITHVPHAPGSVRGVTNMRGRVLPVVDLSIRLGLKETAVTHMSRIMVVESRGRLIGLLVDSVQQVFKMDINGVQAPPPDIMTSQSDYILGVHQVQDDLVILLNVDRILLIKDSLQREAAAGAC